MSEKIVQLNRKAYVHFEDWRNRPLQDGKYRMSMWTVFTCAATGARPNTSAV